MQPFKTLILAAQLTLGVQGFTVNTDCKSLMAQSLDSALPQQVHWAKAGCRQALLCEKDRSKECCDSRIENSLPLSLIYSEAAPFYQKCAGIDITKPRQEDEIVLPSFSCDKIRNFSCGLGFSSKFCDIIFAERSGCSMLEKCKDRTDRDECCGSYTGKDQEASRRYFQKCLGTCATVTDQITEQADCLAIG
ncbi:hypothetical protein MY10362_000390 [Beauveria mimosiformis]